MSGTLKSPIKQKPKPSNRRSWGGSTPPPQEANEDAADNSEQLESPRGFLQRRPAFNDKDATNSEPSDSARAGPSSNSAGLGDDSPPRASLTDRSPHAPPIAPLKLGKLGSRPPQPLSLSQAPHAPGHGQEQPLGASASLSGGAAIALGAAPLSGFRSGRFTPRGSTPRGSTPRRNAAQRGEGSSTAAASSSDHGATAATAAASTASKPLGVETNTRTAADVSDASDSSDDSVSTECGELRAFVLRGPPLPPMSPEASNHRAADVPSAASALPRSFWDACTVVTDHAGAQLSWPAGAVAPDHLRHFCFPSSLVEKLRIESTRGATPDGFGFTFSFTAADGSVRWGCAVTGSDGAQTGALTAVSVALIGDWPLVRPMLEACKELFRLAQREHMTCVRLGGMLRALAASLASSSAEMTFLLQHPLWLPTPLAPLVEAARFQAETLLLVFLAGLLERPLLLASSAVAKLMPVAAALAHTLSPLSFSATFIPFLPVTLHPDPATLVNCSPTPFIIGVERRTLPLLSPIAPHVLIFDLDDGSLAGDEVLDELRRLCSAPAMARLQSALHRFTSSAAGGTARWADAAGLDAAAASSGGGDDVSHGTGRGVGGALSPGVGSPGARSERSLQGIFLSLMRELLATQTQPILRGSGEATDVGRAAEVGAACDLAEDMLRCTADLPGRELIARRVLMCRADSLVRITAMAPQTPTCALLHAAYESRTVREFLLATPAADGGAGKSGAHSFADASWMASGLDAGQSIAEHAMALDAVQGLLEQRLSAACPQLLSGGMLSPRTANFQQRFEVGVNEALLGAFGCALHYSHGLRQGVLHVSERHLCFEAASYAAAYTKLPLSSIASVEPCRDPLFHLIPNAIRVSADDGSALVFASFVHRDEAHALLMKAIAADGAPAPATAR